MSEQVEVVADGYATRDFIREKIVQKANESFCVVDLGQLPHLYEQWKLALPEVEPFYAVKAYNDPLVMKVLENLGTGFDCASKTEIEAALSLGVTPDRIIFAHPCKMQSHLMYAAEKGIRLMTFDTVSELKKVKSFLPAAELVIRLSVEEDSANSLAGKFGCSVSVAKYLIDRALSLDLNVVGVSFHVGSGCYSPSCYQSAIERCAQVFEYGASVGCKFQVLDIGGGFPGGDNMTLFREEAAVIRESLQINFNKSKFPHLRVIAEPGRYFSATLIANAVCITNVRTPFEAGEEERCYYITDGLYGSLNSARFDPFVKFIPLTVQDTQDLPEYKSIVWGPTCCSIDMVCKINLPELEVGDWLYFDNVGAYHRDLITPFNGFEIPPCYYFIRERDLLQNSILSSLKGRVISNGLCQHATRNS